jgi:hypothetical protein
MPSDPTKPLLRLIPQADRPRQTGRAAYVPLPDAFPRDRQTNTFGPKFDRLAQVLARGADALELRADPAGLAPERLLVFEVRSSINAFGNAVRRIGGLELVDEEELQEDEADARPCAYLLVPDMAALRNIESLWRRWQNGRLARSETPWGEVFSLLRDLRPWGPLDRVNRHDAGFLAQAIDGLNEDDLVRLEVELVYRASEAAAAESEADVRRAIRAHGGTVISRARISEIAYHALLADLPVRAVREIIDRRLDGIAGLEPVLHIRPQSAPTTIEIAEAQREEAGVPAPGPLGEPILALLDGVPVAAHRLLADHVDIDDPFGLEPDALVANRSHGTAMASLIIHGDRNGLTVGACNSDAVPPADRALARAVTDPFPQLDAANPSSSLGPGFARSVKPDILMPGAREHMLVVRNHDHIEVAPAGASRGAGLKVAAPPRPGRENLDGYTNGTSAAAALASRTCHRIHDALEAEYGETFLALPAAERAVLIKALLIHPARWPRATADLIKTTVGPHGRGQASKQKDNIRRFLGFGVIDADDAIACASDRATFFASGSLARDRSVTIAVPVPLAMGGKARPHSLSATLAWFTPVVPGRKNYRTCRLKILNPACLGELGVKPSSWQPDEHQTNRGTVFTRCWEGSNAPVITPDMTIPLIVQRERDQGTPVDEPVVFGLAVTLAMPGEIDLYDEVFARVQQALRSAARP